MSVWSVAADRASPMISELARTGDPHCVSVIVPCRNEVEHIGTFCDGALAQRLPMGWRMQIIVADGMSNDGTVEALRARADRDDRLLIVPNPEHIVSTGLNIALAYATGQVIVRMDVHTQFAPDYVAECIKSLQRTGADNVGGPWVASGVGLTGQAVAAAFQCRWVVGGARSRQTDYEGPADTVYLGCWPRAVLAAVGGFDEALVRNQDDEHNLRLKRVGRVIWQSTRIRSWYTPRDSLKHLFRQQYQYGYWRPFVARKHGQLGSVRQLVPAAFVFALAVSMSVWTAWRWPSLALGGAYAAYLAFASVMASRPQHDDVAPADARRSSLLIRLPMVIAVYHMGYGLGTWRGLLDVARGRRVSARSAKISR